MALTEAHARSDSVESACGPDGAFATQPYLQLEYSQNKEVDNLRNNMTELGDEETVRQTQLDSEMPASLAASSKSQVDDHHMEGSREVNVNAELKQGQDTTEDDTVIEGKLLSRPKSSGSTDGQNEFVFARASRQQMDLVGTRKGPLAGLQPGSGKRVKTPSNAPRVEAEATDNAIVGSCVTPYEPTTSAEYSGTSRLNSAMDEKILSVENSPLSKNLESSKTGPPGAFAETSGSKYHDAAPVETSENLVCSGLLEDNSTTPDECPSAPNIMQEVECRPDIPSYVPVGETGPTLGASGQSQQKCGQYDETTQLEEAIDVQRRSPSVRTKINTGSEKLKQQDIQPSRSEHGQDAESRGRSQGTNVEPDVDHTSHQVSNRHGNPRVSKPKRKKVKKVMAPVYSEKVSSNDQLSEINDYIQIVSYKTRQMTKCFDAKTAAQQEQFEAELNRLVDEKQVLQDQNDNVMREKETLEATRDILKEKVAFQKSESKKFAAFLKGLGNDMNALKQDSNADRLKHEKLAEELKACRDERDNLFSELERFAKLEEEHSHTCQEAKAKLDEATNRSQYLDRTLNETAGMLAEERDRRSKLEKQLDSYCNASMSMDQKLFDILSAFKKEDRRDGMSDMLQKTFHAVQTLSSRAGTTVDEVASAKVLLEKLSESVTEHLHGAALANDDTVTSNLHACLEESFASLKGELSYREERIQRDAETREHMKSLEERLRKSDARIVHADSLVSEAQENQKKLQEENTKLQAKVDSLQSEISPAKNVQVQLNEKRAELNDKIKALESTKTALNQKADEVDNLSISNDNLQQQLWSLQGRFEEIQNTVVDFTPEREELQRKSRAEVEQVRKEMAEHSEKFEAELKMQTGNELKKLTNERNRFEKQLDPMKKELSVCKTRIQELETGTSSAHTTKDRELERLRNLAQSQKQEVQTLQASLNNLRNPAKGDASLERDCVDLTAQLENERKKLLQMSEEKSALLVQVETLQSTADEARISRDQTKSELEHFQIDKTQRITVLQQELAESQAAVERAEAGREQLQNSCDDVINETKRKCDRDIKALQNRVSEAEGERDAEREGAKRFNETVEQAWQSQQQQHETQISEIEQKFNEAESQRDEALRDIERIRQECQQALDEQRNSLTEQSNNMQRRATIAEEKLRVQEQKSDESATGASRFFIPNLAEDITPTVSLDSNSAPAKPRKKADRNTKVMVENSPLSAPKASCLENQKNDSGERGGSSPGSGVEDSQHLFAYCLDKAAQFAEPERKRMESYASTKSDDMLTTADESRLLPETIDETQSAEKLPSFAVFNTSLGYSAQAPRLKRGSSKLSQASSHDLRDCMQQGVPQFMHSNASSTFLRPHSDLSNFEDPQGSHEMSKFGKSDSQKKHQDGRSLSQEETAKWTFQKSFPHPNSASKRVRQDTRPAENAARRFHTTRGIVEDINAGFRFETRQASSGRMNSAAYVKSSTPDFVNSSIGRTTKLQPHASSGRKRHSSKTYAVSTADPRLTAREAQPAQPKRKSEAQIEKGLENERKKRRAAHPKTGEADDRRFNLRSHSNTAVDRGSSFLSAGFGSGTSQYQAGSAMANSRARGLAGESSRSNKGGKKVTKHDEINARFSQELAGR